LVVYPIQQMGDAAYCDDMPRRYTLNFGVDVII